MQEVQRMQYAAVVYQRKFVVCRLTGGIPANYSSEMCSQLNYYAANIEICSGIDGVHAAEGY
jgi:hypothetical protein